MKTGSGFLVAGIVIILIGVVWLIVGGSGSAPLIQGLEHNHDSSPPPEVTMTGGPATGTTPPVQTQEPTLAPSQDAIRLHLIDLAFGESNVNLLRWDPAKNNGRISISLNGGNTGDLRNLEALARQFNSLSGTNQISENIKQDSRGDITIQYVPESGMGALALNESSGSLKEVTLNGVTAAKITPTTIYLNTNLKGDVRNHTLIRSLYYNLGIVGETDTVQNSPFYSKENTNTNLTYIDQKALELLYGKRLQPGMSAGEVKEILYIK